MTSNSFRQPLSSALNIDGQERFDLAFLRRLLQAIDVRLQPLQEQQASAEDLLDNLQGLTLDRINNILTPAIQQVFTLTSRGFLIANSSTVATIANGDVHTFIIGDETERELFTPSPFTALTRLGSTEDYGIARTISYDQETGEYECLVLSVYGSGGPHSDWVIGAMAGSTIAQYALFADAQALREAMNTESAEAVEAAREWAEKETAPDGPDTMSARTAAKLSTAAALAADKNRADARAWAEGPGEPQGVAGAKSAKVWSEQSHAWAEGVEPGGAATKSAKDHSLDAGQRADAAADSAVQAALYDGPKVDTFAELAGVTPAMLGVDGLIRCTESAAVLVRVTSGEDLDYTGSGGIKLAFKASLAMSPEMAGGDLHLAGQIAERLGVPLFTPEADYEVQNAFEPANITWFSANTRIKMMRAGSGGTDPLDSAVYPGSNVKQIGRLRLHLEDLGAAAAYRAHMLCGRWDTGEGPTNLSFDEIYLEGGHDNCNGVAVASGSNIRINKIDAGTTTKIGRAFMAHWSNFDDHYLSGGTYQHAPGAGPTVHPHDIHIGEIVGDITISSGDFCALHVVSAGYDVSVGRVSGSVDNSGAGPGNLVLFTAGDLGMAYGTADDLARGMRGLRVGSVAGSVSSHGINRIGRALYYNADSTPQSAENYMTKIHDSVDEVVITGAGNNIQCCVDGHNGRGRSKYGVIKSTSFRSAIVASNYTRDFNADIIEAIDNQNQGVQLVGSGATQADWPEEITIGRLIVNGTGGSEATAGQSTVSNINKIVGLRIGEIIVDKLKPGMTFATGSVTVGADVVGVQIDILRLNWQGTGQTIAVLNSAAAEGFVDIGHIICPVDMTPVSGGVTTRVVGRNREYHFAGGAVPSGITVRVGDRFYAAAAGTGQYFVQIVKTAGVTGSGAVLTGFWAGS